MEGYEASRLNEQEVIEKLSQIHKGHSTDPETLCSATLHDFDLNHPNAADYPVLQPRLIRICIDAGYEWTKH